MNHATLSHTAAQAHARASAHPAHAMPGKYWRGCCRCGLLNVWLLLCLVMVAAHAEDGVRLFGPVVIPIHQGGTAVDYTWDSATEAVDVWGTLLHTDTYKNAAEMVMTVQGRVNGNAGNAAQVIGGTFSGILLNGTYFADGKVPRSDPVQTPGASGRTYSWSEGWDFRYMDDTTWQLELGHSSDTYTAHTNAGTTQWSFQTSVDATGNGTLSGDETGVLFNGNFYFDWSHLYNSQTSAGTYGANSYSLFHATYGISGLTYSVGEDNLQNRVLSAREQYAGSNDGSLFIFYPNVNVAVSNYNATISGSDPLVGSFTGNLVYGQGITFNPRTAHSFAPSNPSTLWVNSTLVTWTASTLLNSEGKVRDTYSGPDGNGNTVKLMIEGDLPAWAGVEISGASPEVTITVKNIDNIPVVPDGSGTYVKGPPNYFSVAGWYVGTAQYSRPAVPLWLPNQANLWVNGSRYSFAGGVDGASTNVDTYANASLGTLVISGDWTGSSTAAGVLVSYNGGNYTGSYSYNPTLSGYAIVVGGLAVELSAPDLPAVWVSGHLYVRSAGNDTLYGDGAGRSLIAVVANGDVQIVGNDGISLFTGSFAAGGRGIFQCMRVPSGWLPACPANADGSLRLDAVAPPDNQNLPPAVKVSGEIWPYLGSIGDPADPSQQVAWYGSISPPPSACLKITGNVAGIGQVMLTDFASATATSKTGSYNYGTHLFQTSQTAAAQLPMPIYGTEGPNGNNVRWGWLHPADGRPDTILVAGEVWGFTDTDGAGNDHYAGYYTGQEMAITAPGIGGVGLVSLNTAGSHYDGIFSRGGFLMYGGPVVSLGNAEGTVTGPSDGLGRLTNSAADLDISGNVLTLGSWLNEPTHAGMALQYSEPAADGKALIYLSGSRADTSFIWNRATYSGSSALAPMMLLGGGDHSLKLFGPSDPANAAITMNPSGLSHWMIVGPYPDTEAVSPDGNDRSQGVLVIGAGTKAGATITRRNALRVTEDGVVLIRESGDIPMGEFSAGPRP